MRLRRTGKSGFTLVELMVVVAIIAILAAVAIPAFIKYMRKSKASEAFTLLQGIREKQESYFGEFKRFSDTIGWEPYDPGTASNAGVCGSNHNWDITDTPEWGQLGFVSDGPTYYTYSVETGYLNGILQQAYAATPDTVWPAVLEPWYRGIAEGDIDCDTVVVRFYITSHNHSVVQVDRATNTPNDEVY
ncbi:prepilin-type N-terminal cleavage/methylation domain-containing protein [Myxococcota bacterium]